MVNKFIKLIKVILAFLQADLALKSGLTEEAVNFEDIICIVSLLI